MLTIKVTWLGQKAVEKVSPLTAKELSQICHNPFALVQPSFNGCVCVVRVFVVTFLIVTNGQWQGTREVHVFIRTYIYMKMY